jgi:hypothetical protein
MEYGITKASFDGEYFVPIMKDEFLNAWTSRENLAKALGVEEKFNIALENYLEYEGELLDITLRKAISRTAEWSSTADLIHRMNRRIVNLLSTCRLYLDQAPQDLSSMLGKDSDVKESFRAQRAEEYDSRFGYRFMEALRNHIQHRSLPVHLISFKSSWVEDEEGGDSRHRRQRTTIKINVSRLEEDEGFKKVVLGELRKIGSQVNLKPLVREYITGLMKVHQSLREGVRLYLDEWEEDVLSLIKKYRDQTEKDGSILHAVSRNSEGKIIKKISLFEDLILRRKELERKNRGFGDLSLLRISSR